MEEAKPRPAPAGISPRGCRLRDDRITRPRTRGDQPWHRRKPPISTGTPCARGNHQSRHSLPRNGRRSTPGAAKNRLPENRRPAPAPAGINRLRRKENGSLQARSRARGDQPHFYTGRPDARHPLPRPRRSTLTGRGSPQEFAAPPRPRGSTLQVECFKAVDARSPTPEGISPSQTICPSCSRGNGHQPH